MKSFDREAKLIVQSETLPKKSMDRCLLVYNAYKKCQKENEEHLSRSKEADLIVYFNQQKKKLAPLTI